MCVCVCVCAWVCVALICNKTQTLDTGDRYKGQMQSGKRHGQGVYTSVSGDRYEGELRNGKKLGHGVLILANGTRHEGEWRDGKTHKREKNTVVVVEADEKVSRMAVQVSASIYPFATLLSCAVPPPVSSPPVSHQIHEPLGCRSNKPGMR